MKPSLSLSEGATGSAAATAAAAQPLLSATPLVSGQLSMPFLIPSRSLSFSAHAVFAGQP